MLIMNEIFNLIHKATAQAVVFIFSVCFQCGFLTAERLGRRKNSHDFDDKYVAIPIDFALCRDKIYFQTDKGNLTRNIFIQPDKT